MSAHDWPDPKTFARGKVRRVDNFDRVCLAKVDRGHAPVAVTLCNSVHDGCNRSAPESKPATCQSCRAEASRLRLEVV